MSAINPRTDPARLYRTTRIFAEALERRRVKIAAGIPVEPPPECDCAECREAVNHA
jgi:hypothetical protein